MCKLSMLLRMTIFVMDNSGWSSLIAQNHFPRVELANLVGFVVGPDGMKLLTSRMLSRERVSKHDPKTKIYIPFAWPSPC